MPELPEVETCRKGLIANNILNKEIAEVRILQTKLREEIPSDLPTLLKNQQFTNIYRRAKYLIFATTNGGCVISHLGMTGQWIFLPSENATNNANSNANFVNLQHKHLHLILQRACRQYDQLLRSVSKHFDRNLFCNITVLNS